MQKPPGIFSRRIGWATMSPAIRATAINCSHRDSLGRDYLAGNESSRVFSGSGKALFWIQALASAGLRRSQPVTSRSTVVFRLVGSDTVVAQVRAAAGSLAARDELNTLTASSRVAPLRPLIHSPTARESLRAHLEITPSSVLPRTSSGRVAAHSLAAFGSLLDISMAIFVTAIRRASSVGRLLAHSLARCGSCL